MERYQTYMDGITMPDTLTEKLLHLEKRPRQNHTWQRYCAPAASIVLVACIAVLGIRGTHPGNPHGNPVPPVATAAHGQTDPTPVLEQTKAPAEPETTEGATIEPPLPDPNPRPDLDHGYTVYQDGTALFFDLPDLLFNPSPLSADSAGNYVLNAMDGTARALDWTDMMCLAGGEAGLQDHLLWSGLTFAGDLYFNRDGTFHALALSGNSSDWNVSLEMLEGREVPDCVEQSPDSVTEWEGVSIAGQNVEGCAVSGVSYWGRRVSFQCGGYGYKYTAYALSSKSAENLCARFVRYIVAGGFHPSCLAASGSADNQMPEPADLGGVVLPSTGQMIPDRGAVPSEMPTVMTVSPEEGGNVDPVVPPVPGADEEGDSAAAAEPSPALPDKGVPPADMPTANIIHPGEEGDVDPLPPPPDQGGFDEPDE